MLHMYAMVLVSAGEKRNSTKQTKNTSLEIKSQVTCVIDKSRTYRLMLKQILQSHDQELGQEALGRVVNPTAVAVLAGGVLALTVLTLDLE